VPIVILTAAGEEGDRIRGLEAGADDYVVKPFSARELTARLRAVLRRGARTVPGAIGIGSLELVPARRQLLKDGEPVALSPREYDLLAYLLRASPRVVPRDELIAEVWDPHWHGPTKTLDVHVLQLRRKIEDDPGRPRYLHTERGVGYRMEDACADA
jgi:two-component system response regulator RegX3